MSTTWTSIINTNSDGTPQGVTIGLENGNYTFNGAGNSATTPLPGGTSSSTTVPFTGLINTGDDFNFGTNSEFALSTPDGNSLNFNYSGNPADHQVVFNFNDTLKLYGNGVLKMSNNAADPSTTSFEEGSIAIVGNTLKILKEN